MPSPGGGGSGLPRRLPNDPPPLGPRALSFTEPHAATWDADNTTTSRVEVYEVTDDDFSPNHWTPDYSESRASSAAGYFTNMMGQEVDDDLELLKQQDATPNTGGKGASKRGSNYTNLENIQLCKSWMLEQRRIEVEEQRLQWVQKQKIMFCDVTTMDDDQRAYVLTKRAKIVAC